MKTVGTILTFIFAFIDSIIAKMITLVYNLLMNLSNLVLYNDSIVKAVGQRIGIILGIFMLFRIAVSLINYMISPEKFSDNKTGGGQLVKNIIISLVLIATVNVIFESAYMVQKRIVESGIVQKIFFGENSNTKDIDIGYYLYTGLFAPDEEIIPECKEMWDPTKDISQECDDKLFEYMETNARNSVFEARNNLDVSKVLSNFDVVTANRDGAFTGTELFNYTPLVSNAVGVIALIILVSFSMELAIRAVKLLFLQIIAPVPIIANMDTGKGKDMFNKWVKQCINTYISVFIRLIAINFGVFMIVLVKGNFNDIFSNNVLLNIFIIIGCLMFAKQVPKLIEEMFGIKLDGMTLHPLKNFKENALFGSQITGLARGAAAGAIGIGTGAFGAAIASHKLSDGSVKGDLATVGSFFRGGLRGMAGGIGAGYKSKNGLEALKAGRGRWGAEADYVNLLDGTTFKGRVKSGIQQRMHIATDADVTKRKIDALNSFHSAADAAFNRAKSEMVKDDTLTANGITMLEQKQKQEQLQIMRSGGPTRKDFTDDTGFFDQNAYNQAVEDHSKEVAKLQKEILDNEREFAIQWINKNRNVDGELMVSINQMEKYKDKIEKFEDPDMPTISISDGASIKKAKESTLVRKQQIEGEFKNGVNIYQQQQANAAATKPKGGK